MAGRPTKYKADYCALAANYCSLGATDADLARFFGCSLSTLHTWKLSHPAFSAALKDAKSEKDAKVERSLLERALGYEYTEVMDEEGSTGTKTRTTKKRIAPDVTAQIFWLKNRQPDKWRDKQHVDLEGKMAVTFNMDFGLRPG